MVSERVHKTVFTKEVFMTKEFEDWFEKYFPVNLWPVEEDREEMKLYTWLAWRDSRRSAV